jgi:hypothetical protein
MNMLVHGLVRRLMQPTASGSSGGAPGPGAPAAPAAGPAPGGMMTSAAGGLPILTPGYLQAHRVGIPGQKDVIWNPIYDSNIYPSSGVTSQALAFFTNQQGAGTSYSPGAYMYGAGKTNFDTNLQSPNAFTLGQEFYCIGSETDLFPGLTTTATTSSSFSYYPGQGVTTTAAVEFLNDIWILSVIGFKSLRIGTDRFYIQDGPIMKFPPKSRLYVSAALALATGSTSVIAGLSAVYAERAGSPYIIVPIYFQTNQLFTLTLSFAGAIALYSAAACLIRERLNGYLVRQAT